MSRRVNKIASQADVADVIPAPSEAAGSTLSSAPIRATRGASAALLAKEVSSIPVPVATSSSGLGFRSFSPVASNAVPPTSSSLFLTEDDLPPSNQLGVAQIVPETMLPSHRSNDFARGHAAANDSANEYSVFIAAQVASLLL